MYSLDPESLGTPPSENSANDSADVRAYTISAPDKAVDPKSQLFDRDSLGRLDTQVADFGGYPTNLKLSTIISAFVHVFVLIFLATRMPEPEMLPLTVDLVPPSLLQEKPTPPKTEQPKQQSNSAMPPPPEKQLVSPSEAPPAPTPPKTTRYSDRDTVTPLETIKRGDGATTASQEKMEQATVPTQNPAESQQQPKASASEPKPKSPSRSDSNATTEQSDATPSRQNKATEQKVAKSKTNDGAAPSEGPPRRIKLRLGAEQLVRDFGQGGAAPDESEDPKSGNPLRSDTMKNNLQQARRNPKLSDYKPFRAPTIGQMLTGKIGSPDYLPGVQDGDITMLNAKAEQHAVFVRRVALQVFGLLRQKSWSQLSGSEISLLSDYVTVIAIMDTRGRFISAKIVTASGSRNFDKMVESSATQGTTDQNPPPSATAEDGNIHFIFKSRTWGRSGPGGMDRWLLLGTGLL